MRRIPSLIFRLVGASAVLGLAASRLFPGLFRRRKKPHAALDPGDPAADPETGPAVVRAAGPQSMRDGETLPWDRVDEAVDESVPGKRSPILSGIDLGRIASD